MLGMNPDSPRIGELFILSVARETEVVIIIGLGQLRSTGASVRIMAVETENLCIEMRTLLEVEPLLVMGLGMGLSISPDSGFKLIIVG